MRNSKSSSGSSPKWLRGPIALCLLLCLSGCGGLRTVQQTKVEKQYPPASLVVRTAEPLLLGNTNGGLLQWGLDLRDALGSCNADKGALEQWMQAPAPVGR